MMNIYWFHKPKSIHVSLIILTQQNLSNNDISFNNPHYNLFIENNVGKLKREQKLIAIKDLSKHFFSPVSSNPYLPTYLSAFPKALIQ